MPSRHLALVHRTRAPRHRTRPCSRRRKVPPPGRRAHRPSCSRHRNPAPLHRPQSQRWNQPSRLLCPRSIQQSLPFLLPLPRRRHHRPHRRRNRARGLHTRSMPSNASSPTPFPSDDAFCVLPCQDWSARPDGAQHPAPSADPLQMGPSPSHDGCSEVDCSPASGLPLDTDARC